MKIIDQKVLLLNASNWERFPIFPYAFIQVPAVARQAGIEIICQDLLSIPRDRWRNSLQLLIDQHNPSMILITMRNTDSLSAEDYEPGDSEDRAVDAYFPIERTKELINAIRDVSDLKIAVGGFGFSLFSDELMKYLSPDFGVYGGPDGFFEHFDDIQAGDLGEVANLLFFEHDQLISNPRKYYPPHADIEYTPQAIKEMKTFYDSFPSPGFQGAPIEIMRGCPHSCVFCSEPHVTGQKVRYRDLTAVMGDIKLLVEHGITKIYIISSELNPEGNEYVLQLADKIRLFSVRQPEDQKVTWFGANYLLNFSFEEYERLFEAGFTGGWFDVTALDDENARAMQTTYRNKSLIEYLKTYARFERRRINNLKNLQVSHPDRGSNPKNQTIHWTLFLGNPATTMNTIRHTLRVANQEGLAQSFHGCGIKSNIRVFDYENPNKATLDVTYSVSPDLERIDYKQLLPSFAYSPALLHGFGSEREIDTLFEYIASTFLSTAYQRSRDWRQFLIQNTVAASVARWALEIKDNRGVLLPWYYRVTTKGKPTPELQRLFSMQELPEEEIDLAEEIVDSCLSICLETFPDLLDSLGFPSSMELMDRMTPYELACLIFHKWDTEDEMLVELASQTKSVLNDTMQAIARFSIKALMYKFNLVLNPKYRLLFSPD